MADLDAGPHILAQTAHSAVAGPYHRIGTQIFDTMTIFRGSPAVAETIIARDHADTSPSAGRACSPPRASLALSATGFCMADSRTGWSPSPA